MKFPHTVAERKACIVEHHHRAKAMATDGRQSRRRRRHNATTKLKAAAADGWIDEWMASCLIQKRKSNLAREYASIIVRPKEHQNVYKRFCSSLSLWTKQSNSQYLTLLYDEDKQKDKRRSHEAKTTNR